MQVLFLVSQILTDLSSLQDAISLPSGENLEHTSVYITTQLIQPRLELET